jgi:hypothetical protein
MEDPMSLAYRGLDYAAERRYAEAAASSERAALRGCRGATVFAAERRLARAAAGLVAIVGGLAVFVLALATLGDIDRPSKAPHVLLSLLVMSGVASLLTYAVGRFIARRTVGPLFGREMARTGDPVADLCNLEMAGPDRALSRFASRLEHHSVVLPMIGMSLLMPLTIHAAVSLGTGTIGSYDVWIRISTVLVGHAHLVLALCCWRYARLIRGSSSEALTLRGQRDWGRALGFTTLAAAIPGLLIAAVPPILTVLTGLLFIPFMFNTVRAHVIEERAALAL